MIVGSLLSTTLLAATLNIEVRQPIDDEMAAEIIEWIEATASDVTLVYGRFPNPRAKIIVIPTTENSWGSDSAVIFGRVTRRRGETVELFVNPDRPIEEYYADWTATHELSHLMLPLLKKRYRWISEGFASYYQNVLMARAGHYTQEYAWQRLSDGFERGHQSRPDLSLNEAATSGIRYARMKVYWSGAAIALLADIELRQRSGGTESLDTVLGQLQKCCLPSRTQWSGQRLFKKLDSFLETPVFMPLYRKYANTEGFPNFAPALVDLGIDVSGSGVTLREDRPLAGVRQAISAPQ
jgi:M61 glycyl aminopeptidase